MLYNLDDLNYQFDWRGPRLANLRIKVCRKCLDKPFPFFRPVILPPDPMPRIDPRPEMFDAEMGPNPAPIASPPVPPLQPSTLPEFPPVFSAQENVPPGSTTPPTYPPSPVPPLFNGTTPDPQSSP